MRKEAQTWWAKARRDVETALYLSQGERYEEACFFCQQAVEKTLKAVLIARSGKIVKTHDLVFLAGLTNLPSKFKEPCKELTAVYVATRYPDSPEIVDEEERSTEFIELAGKVLKWAERIVFKKD